MSETKPTSTTNDLEYTKFNDDYNLKYSLINSKDIKNSGLYYAGDYQIPILDFKSYQDILKSMYEIKILVEDYTLKKEEVLELLEFRSKLIAKLKDYK